MTRLENERDINFVNTLSTTVITISVVLIIVLIGYLFFYYLLNFTHSKVMTPYLIIPLIVLLLVLISGCISIKEFNKYGFIVLKLFFGILSLIHLFISLYLFIDNIISIYSIMLFIIIISISYGFFSIYKRLNQIFKT